MYIMSLQFDMYLSNETKTLLETDSGKIIYIMGDCVVNIPSSSHCSFQIFVMSEGNSCVVNSSTNIVGGGQETVSIKLQDYSYVLLTSDSTKYFVSSGFGNVSVYEA